MSGSLGIWIGFAGAATSSFVFSFLICKWVMRLGVVDAPDGARKTQTRPIPRLGGVGILISSVLGAVVSFVALLWIRGGDPASVFPEWTSSTRETAWLLFSSLFVAAMVFTLGLWDDVKTLLARTKLSLLMVIVVVAGPNISPSILNTPFGDVTFGLFLTIGATLWLIVFTNAANFMDGSNGLSIGCLAIMLAGLAITGTEAGNFSNAIWWFPLFGAIGGFLVHNLRGNLYAGDAGALGLGALFATLGLASGLEVWTVATLALPFLVDVLLTLIWRAKHHRPWLKAHRDHAYQRLMDEGWGHIDVAVLYWGLSGVCAVGAWVAVAAGGWVPFTLFWVLLVAGCILWLHQRRSERPDDPGEV